MVEPVEVQNPTENHEVEEEQFFGKEVTFFLHMLCIGSVFGMFSLL